MENMNKGNNKASVVIPSVRISIEPNSNVIDWLGVFDAVALNVWKESQYYMTFQEISTLNSEKHYSIYVTENVCPTKEERVTFVQTTLNNSNFANADKVRFILYVKGSKYPFGVVVEDF